MTTGPSPRVLGPGEGRSVQIYGLGVRFMLEAADSDGRFALVEHPLVPRALGAAVHTHANEDEYTYVLEGEIGFEIGDETLVARPGELVSKPRGIPHAFWNAGDSPARALEIISPAGFERYFDEIAPLFAVDGPPGMQRLGEIAARYGLEFDQSSLPRLAQEHGLDVPL
jgi:mannose-6-phosphate isomerase-like protein (cupin superfamily)